MPSPAGRCRRRSRLFRAPQEGRAGTGPKRPRPTRPPAHSSPASPPPLSAERPRPLRGAGRRKTRRRSLPQGLQTRSAPAAATAVQNRSLQPTQSNRGTAITAGAAPPPASAQNTAGPTWLVPPLPRQGVEGRGDRAGEPKGRVRDPAERRGDRALGAEWGGEGACTEPGRGSRRSELMGGRGTRAEPRARRRDGEKGGKGR